MWICEVSDMLYFLYEKESCRGCVRNWAFWVRIVDALTGHAPFLTGIIHQCLNLRCHRLTNVEGCQQGGRRHAAQYQHTNRMANSATTLGNMNNDDGASEDW